MLAYAVFVVFENKVANYRPCYNQEEANQIFAEFVSDCGGTPTTIMIDKGFFNDEAGYSVQVVVTKVEIAFTDNAVVEIHKDKVIGFYPSISIESLSNPSNPGISCDIEQKFVKIVQQYGTTPHDELVESKLCELEGGYTVQIVEAAQERN